LTRQRLSFPWLFMSQQGLCGLMNPFVTRESSFRGDFWESSDSVFHDCLWVKSGYVGWQILSSPVKVILGAFFDWASTQFSLTVCESTEAVWPDESIHQLRKQFLGLFLSGQWLKFPWLFVSQQGLCALTNPFITCESTFKGYFWVGSDSVFLICLWVNRGCVAWRIHSTPVKVISRAIFD